MNENNDKISQIYDRYETKIKKIEEDYKNRAKKKKRKRNIITFLIIMIPTTILLIPIIIASIVVLDGYGVFDSYDNMYRVSLPVEEYDKKISFYLPEEWHFTEKDGWNSIVDKDENIIAFEVYKGYQIRVCQDKFIWKSFEINPFALAYDYDIENYSMTLIRGCCSLMENQNNYAIYFDDTSYMKENEKRNYSKFYIFMSNIDIKILNKIVNSCKIK